MIENPDFVRLKQRRQSRSFSAMGDEKEKKKLAAWATSVEGEAATPAASVEMVRKALALNPKLKGKASTLDITEQVERAAAERPLAPTPSAEKKEAVTDLLEAMTQARERFDAELDRLTKEEKRAQEEKKALFIRTLDRVNEVIMTIDPNMTSPRTMVVLEDEKEFLKRISFDVRKLVEKQRARR
jgi:hypothetical protein